MKNIISFDGAKKAVQDIVVLKRWVEYYTAQKHEDLLEALIFEHENDFPLRRSVEMMDQLRHRALVQVLNERAQTEFLKSFLVEINSQSVN